MFLPTAEAMLKTLIARHQAPPSWPYQPLSTEDIQSIVAFAVLRAVRRYNRERGAWPSYLRLWVRAEMKAYLPCLGLRRNPSRTGLAEFTNMRITDE